jgi:bifunctional enzyme CysN/CysC
LFEPDDFLEVFVDTPIALAEERDPKGLYKKARSRELSNFIGIDSEYQPPKNPGLILKTEDRTVAESAKVLVQLILTHAQDQ